MSCYFVDKNFYKIDDLGAYEKKLIERYEINNNLGYNYLIVKLKEYEKSNLEMKKIDSYEIIEFIEFIKNNENYYRIYKILLKDKLKDIDEIEEEKDERAYLNILKELIEKGDYRETRNAKTFSLFGRTLKFNLKDKYPLLTTKKTFFRGVIEELIFFLQGKTNSKLLEDKGINIWTGNTNKDFLQKMNLPYDEGDMGPMYGFNWLHFGAKYKGMNNEYKDEGVNQIKDVIKLLKNDPHSRRILFTTYNPEVAKEGVLYPCHGLISQLYINERDGYKYLSLSTYQRSADAFLGLPFNIASYGALVYILCKILGSEYKPDELIINLGDIHIYENHVEQCMEQISRKGYKFPKLEIKDFVAQSLEEGDFSGLKYEDFELKDYKSHKLIKAEMVA